MKQSIANDAFKLTASNVINLIVSLVIVMLLSRFRTLEEYGTYSQLLMSVSIITTIFMLGLPNSINFFLVRVNNEEQRRKFISVFYTLDTALSFITGLVLVLSTSIIVDYFDNPLIKNYMYVFAILPWANMILSSIQNVFIVYKLTAKLMLFTVANVVSLLLIVIIVEIFNWGFNIYMMLFVAVEALYAISVYLIVKKITGKIYFSFDKRLIEEILKFSIPLGLASIVGTLSIELGKLFIGKLYTVSEFAIYTNAAKELPVTIIASSLTAVLMPHLVRYLKENKFGEATKLWGDATSLSYLFICFFATGLFVYAPEVITLLYSDKFLPGVTVFRIYCIVILLRCTYFGIVLNSIGRTKYIFYSSILALILNVILMYPLYLIFGFVGPAIATFISVFIVNIMQLIATSKEIDISFNKIFPWGSLGRITIVNILMGLTFFAVKDLASIELVTGEVIESILLGVLWTIVYMLIMFKPIKGYWGRLQVS